MDNQQADAQEAQPVVDLDYWVPTAFHLSLMSVPFKQNDPDGVLVVNVNDHFFKLKDGQLVMARVPEDLSLPTEWQPVPDGHPLRDKAVSMIGAQGVA
jgi:hypothetical protein